MGLNNNKEEQIEQILKTADGLFRKLFPSIPEDLLKLDITMPQMKIMLILYFNGALRMSAIASRLGVTLPTASSLVDKLIKKKYLLRESRVGDRRVVLCALSSKGEKSLGRIWNSARIKSKQLLEIMDASKIQMFLEVLESMLKSAATDGEQNIVPSKNEDN
jgi:DNA-binding MarR family transcriptional regulator